MSIINRGFIYLILALAAFASCKEEPPGINYKPSSATLDTTYITNTVPTADMKAVLLEDVSGVRCVNCPEASTIAVGLMASNPGRVNVINTQPDLLALSILCKPINDPPVVSVYDFRTSAATDILNAVAIPNSLPSGFIDRKIFSPNLDAIVDRTQWTNDVNAELGQSTPVNIELTTTYNNATTELTTDVKITYTSLVTDSNYLSIAIIEDSIVDAQETKDANNNTIYIQNYLHRHVLRDMYTSSTGDLINKTNQITLTPGRVIEKRFTKKIKALVDYKTLGVVAYVHKGASGKYYVLHSKSAEVE